VLVGLIAATGRGQESNKETKFINCRIGPFWHAVWLVI
jgi:hypothetical protein